MSTEPVVDADPAYDQARFTPMQALYHLLTQTGYVKSKLEFARLLKINEGNIYAYLADPAPRDDNELDDQQGKNRSRISPRAETLHGWCWALREVTGLAIDVILRYDGKLVIEARGTDARKRVIQAVRYDTVYLEYDFPEPIAWLTLATAQRMYAALAVQRASAMQAEQGTSAGRSRAAMIRERKKIDKQLDRVRERLVQLVGLDGVAALDAEHGLVVSEVPPSPGAHAEA